MINLNHSRRVAFNKCTYWKREENFKGDANELIHKKKPSGIFFAKPVNNKNKEENNVNGVMMFTQDNITLETQDKVNIDRGDIVWFRKGIWFVDRVQAQEILRESQYMSEQAYIYYLDLRK